MHIWWPITHAAAQIHPLRTFACSQFIQIDNDGRALDAYFALSRDPWPDPRISSVSRCSQSVSPLNQHATRRPNLIFTRGPSSETSCHLHANRTPKQEEKQEVKMSKLPVKRTLTFWCLPSFVVRCDKKKKKCFPAVAIRDVAEVWTSRWAAK